MSRVDQALKIWERTGGVEAREASAAHSTTPSVLNQYPREEPNPHSGEERDSPRILETARSPRPALSTRRTATRAAKRTDDIEIQARLVTGGSSILSVEQYRRLAAVLHEEQVQSQLKSVMVTSALPREGKTLTLVNLALTLSESYARRVLVIDADLRCPGLHAILDVQTERGLCEALHEPRHELPFVEVSSRLSVLTAGKPGPTPLAVLTSNRMREVIETCAARFDWVLIDASPVGIIPDAQVLARLVGAVILVIGAGSTPAAAVERAIAELGGADSIMGAVLNRVEERLIPEADFYGHYGTSRDTVARHS
ncbi:MAG TPA: CpsD/CapB family tyrosine-protein kinase [Vicinamibacterales bacterium]|nr:CpsD/CapB family tyrosine-protein kinase [Vicinamibacterales bacterium]